MSMLKIREELAFQWSESSDYVCVLFEKDGVGFQSFIDKEEIRKILIDLDKPKKEIIFVNENDNSIICSNCLQYIKMEISIKEIQKWLNSGKQFYQYFDKIGPLDFRTTKDFLWSNYTCKECLSSLDPEDDIFFDD